MKILPQIAQRIPVRQDSLLQNAMKKAKYGVAGVRSGTILLKPGSNHWNATPHQEGDSADWT
jgi:hypothetical protein